MDALLEALTIVNLIFALTLVAVTCYAVLAWVFMRFPHNRIMRAMAWYFAAMFVVYAGIVIVEGLMNVSVKDGWWAQWRALFFRGSQAAASLWLLVEITRRR